MNRQAKAFALLNLGMDITSEIQRGRWQEATDLSRRLNTVLESIVRESAACRRPGARSQGA